MYKLYLLGIGPGEYMYGLDDHRAGILNSCGCIVTSRRYKPLIGDRDAEFLPIAPVWDAVTAIRDRLLTMDVAVVASGDPLFFGIGRMLVKELGKEQVEPVPAVSYMQAAFAKFKEPWDDAAFISLHGRRAEDISSLVLPCRKNRKIFMFTDDKNSPSSIASTLIKEGVTGYSAFVAEDLGMPEEKLTSGSLEEIAEGSFSSLSVMILKHEQASAQLQEECPLGPLGLREDEIVHSRGLITKSEVRAAVLHRLRLPNKAGGVFWDIGAGSGSVSIEAARICPALSVYAVEKHSAGLKNIRTNIKRFAINNISVIAGEAPSCLASLSSLSDLPEPDRVFVGGSGGRLREILEHVSIRLKPGGIVVVNAVTESTITSAPQILLGLGFCVESSEIALTRTVWTNAGQEKFQEKKQMNPIHIIAAER